MIRQSSSQTSFFRKGQEVQKKLIILANICVHNIVKLIPYQ